MADTPKQDRDNKLPRERQGGRFVTKYDPVLALRICERVAEGETLKSICEGSSEFPARQTFHRWVVNEPELNRAYAAARELSAHSLEEEALDMARELSSQEVPKDQIRALDVAMNQLRWSAGKRNARVYSEKAAVSFTVPIQINTTLNLGEQEDTGPSEHPDVYSLEAKIEGEPTVEAWDSEKEQHTPVPDRPFAPSNREKSAQARAEKKAKAKARPKRKRGQYGVET